MYYLYHRVPHNLSGEILYPMNELKDILPNIYADEVKKYEGRKEITEQKIPFLNCLWNDVLHMSAVHPAEVKAELAKNGQEMRFTKFFRIDPFSLASEKTVVYLYRHTRMEDKLKEENFAPYNPEKIAEYAVLPEETKKYYAEIITEGGKPLLWHRVPHILYKGRLDVSKLEIIDA